MRLTRKDFLKVTAVMTTGLVLGCGDDDGGGTAATGTGANGSGGGDAGGNGSGGTGTGATGTGATGTGGTGNTGGQGGGSQGGGGAGQGGAGGQAAGDCLANGTNVDISGNHGHSLTVPAQDVMDGLEKTYDMPTPHLHSVTVTAADFTTLAGGMSVTLTSTVGGQGAGHPHTVTISCA